MNIKCSNCNQYLPDVLFHNDSNKLNGKKSRCIKCAREKAAEANARKRAARRMTKVNSSEWDIPPTVKLPHSIGTLNGPLGQLGREYRVQRFMERA